MVRAHRCVKSACCTLALLLACGQAFARTLSIDIDSIASPAATLQQVQVQLQWEAGADTGELQVRAEVLDVTDSGYRFLKPRWTCRLQRSAAGAWQCNGAAQASAGKGTLSATLDDTALDARFAAAGARVSVRYPLSGAGAGTQFPLQAQAIPAAWLQPLLVAAWPQARFTDGRFDAELVLDTSVADTLQVAGTIATDSLGLDTTDGRIAAAGLALQGPLSLQLASQRQVEADLRITGGEVLAGALYAALPTTGAQLQVSAAGSGAQWSLSRLRWHDAAVLRVDASMQLLLDHDAPLRTLQLEVASDDLEQASARYLDSVFGTLGLAGLQLEGTLQASATLDEGALQRAHASLGALHARDARERFAVANARGAVGWSRSADPLQGTLQWDSAALYGLPVGASSLSWRSSGGALALQEPAPMQLLGGKLLLQQLEWVPASVSGAEPELALALALDGVDLGDLSQRFGWPEFGGSLSGRIPSVRYEGGVLRMDGGLTLGMFDGRVEVGTLALERPFGVAPTLGADIRLRNLDLVPLTQAFGFGSISGRLDGSIAGLRLVDWQPVAFDAQLLTSTSAPDKRRISQRAVGDLSSVGGTGAAGGIQQQVLRLFETFPYEQIGLSCVLENNVCRMGGLPGTGSSSGGYTIVQGSGLPRITVVGHQRRVDFPVLLSRLQAATAGQAPVVD